MLFFCAVFFFHTLDNGHTLHTSKEGEYQVKECFSLNQEIDTYVQKTKGKTMQ